MTTSSGETGWCDYCGHLMNVHTSPSTSKCKKCMRRFLICQASLHGKSLGWKICHIPCGCGRAYYPSHANEATPLEVHEFAESHPWNNSAPAYGSIAYSTYGNTPGPLHLDDQGGSASNQLVYVDVTRQNGYLVFQDAEDEEPYSTLDKNWTPGEATVGGKKFPCFLFKDKQVGITFYTWTLHDDAGASSAKKGGKSSEKKMSHGRRTITFGSYKGKSTATHQRGASAESVDPLQWDAERYAAETLTSGMASLSVGEPSSSHQAEGSASGSGQSHTTSKTVAAKARATDKSHVRIKGDDGHEQEVKRDKLVASQGGYVYESKSRKCTYFIKEIKSQKKK